MAGWTIMTYINSWFIKFWVEQYDDQGNIILFLEINFLIVFATLIIEGIRSTLLLKGCIIVVRSMNLSMLTSLAHASLAKFFDRVPIGRILNRFLKDTEIVDLSMSYAFDRLVFILYYLLT